MKKIIALVLPLMLIGCGAEQPTPSNNPSTSYYDSVKDEHDASTLPKIDLEYIITAFHERGIIVPNGNRVRVCSGYDCKYQHSHRVTPGVLEKIRDSLAKVTSGVEERSALGSALQLVEAEVGDATGTATDKAGIGWMGNGDEGQMDDIDEAFNTTSYLLVLYRYELLRYHDLLGPKYVDGYWVTVIKDRNDGKEYSINTSINANGGEVVIQEIVKD